MEMKIPVDIWNHIFSNIFVTLAESAINQLLTLAKSWPNIYKRMHDLDNLGNVGPTLYKISNKTNYFQYFV